MKGILTVTSTGLLLVCTLAGCGPSNSSKQRATASRAPREATPHLAMVSPESPRSTPSAPAAAGCPADEAVIFACRIASSGKMATLCTTRRTPPITTYRFGDAASSELTVTDADASRANSFHRTPLTFAGATGGYVYSFRNADVTFALYAVSGDEGLNRAGVAVVDASGRKTADFQCDPDSVQETDSLDLIRRTRSWTPDPATADLIR